ncbi:embryonic protein UVS.2-like [Lethenteron reissneri]|uniref:embryonic protein UVS.2-like n=1 Tax=Lethenteron reissneri TaxID=7753 RepID=UPI002AB7D88D|nr:embryonic protein UVS.2-like [Lethenteron reissneri]
MEIRWYDASSVPRLQSLLDVLSQDHPENEKEMLFKVFKEEGGSALLKKILESCKFADSRVQVITLLKKIALLLSQHESTSGEKEFEKTGDIMGDPAEEIKLWPEQSGKVYIPYNVSIAFNASDREAIQQASDELTEKTCIRLIPKDPQEDYFYFRALGRDSSLPGASAEAGARSIALEPNKVDKGVVLRELKHAFHRDQQNGSHDWVKHRDGKVYVLYDVCIGFDTNDKENIQQAVNEFAEQTCIRLIRKDNQEDYINFQALDGSWSFLGKKGGAQSVSLEPGKVDRGTVLHELMHALGFHHEHCRSDRDQHIKVHEDNIKELEPGQFKRLDCSGSGEDLPYDYLSIMHYGRYASSSDHMSETITPTTAAKAPIGQRSGLSPLDVLRVQRKYQPNLAGVSEDRALKDAVAKTAALCETLEEPPRLTQIISAQMEINQQLVMQHIQGLQLERMEAMKKKEEEKRAQKKKSCTIQ